MLALNLVCFEQNGHAYMPTPSFIGSICKKSIGNCLKFAKNYYQMNILIKCICKQIKLSDKKQHSKLKVYNIKPFIVENLMDMQIY